MAEVATSQLTNVDQLNGQVPADGIHNAVQQESISIQINDLKIQGFISEACGVANFLNIPFARIPARFRQAVPINPRKEKGIMDATKYGTRCPQPFDTIHELTKHLYERMATYDTQSEFQCLNLNVYGPPEAISSGAKLPVFVWIHGGAYTYGDGGCEFDGNFLVQRSIKIGKPIIVVGINYRLGYFGFLSSRELREEAELNGEVGYNNQGLYDQRLGLQWVQNNIHVFGGDGFKVTAGGQSAGAFSMLAHLRSNVPVFQQCFIMSCLSRSVLPASHNQAEFDRLVTSTGVSADAPAADKIAALRSLSPKELEALLNGNNAMPCWDEKFWVDQDPALPLEDGPFSSWTKMVVVGMTKDESALFSQYWRHQSSQELLKILKDTFRSAEYLKEVLASYQISEDSSHAELVQAFIKLTTDTLFSVATWAIPEKHKSHPVCLYSFDQEDYHEGFLKGSAYHSMDNSFLFHFRTVAGPDAPPAWRATSDAYSKALIDLAYGLEPWEPYRVAGRAMSLNGEKTGLVKDIGFGRWQSLTNTQARAEMFTSAVALLFTAMKYGMSLDLAPEYL